ncbi:transient receptor potential cation channel subfamily M member 2-like isoform X3 [Bolinopsis microptera]|uniref:transient receptor potential cation channel subfamily M member 2-like isoform X3 n=1 Tax=Bolinopsis microptera TaxID=2820187 RepID=UPI00307905AD
MYVVRDPNNSNPRRSTLDTDTNKPEQIELINKKKKKKKFGRKKHRSDDSEEERRNGYYITDTFCRRECNKFVSNSATEENTCKCGFLDDEHSEAALSYRHIHTADWDPAVDTVTLPTNAYGEIDFLHADNDVLPLYLRCDMEVDVVELGNLLLDKWAMPLPNLLISVFGGHSKFDSKKMNYLAAESDIKEGLVKAARDTKGWLFTSGVNHGVSNLVGDAVAMKRSFVNAIPVIGVNSWGAVANSNDLIDAKEQGLFPAKYIALRQNELERNPETNKPKSMSLEHEHTHFLLVDFGTKNNFHETDVRKFRIKLQQYLVQRTQAQLVSVLIEGGSGSLEEALIRVKTGLPVVVLGDSGRISNVLSLAVDLAKDENVCDGLGMRTERRIQSEDDRMKVRSALTAALPRLEESKYDEFMGIIEEVILHEDLVTIWKCGKGTALDTTILQGLIKSIANHKNSGEPEEEPDNSAEGQAQREQTQRTRAKELMKRQLELAIQWDRLDIATEFIFENKSNNMDLHLTESELNEMLNLAIKHKQIRFIRNIIERNANISSFLTVDRFETILRENTPTNSLFYELMKKKCPSVEHWTFEHFEMVIHDISEGVFRVPGRTRAPEHQVDPSDNGFSLQSIKICGNSKRNGGAANYAHVDNMTGDGRKSKFDFMDPGSLLTVYMVLIHEQELAKVIWEYSSTPLFLGLVCTCINNWLSAQQKETLLISDAMGQQLEEYGNEFEEISEKVLEEVAEYQTEHVIALINFKFVSWGGRTILEMADYVNAVNIIAHPTIQDYIDIEWNGWLDSDMSTLRMIVSILCPLLASFRDVTPFDKWKQKNLQSKKQKVRDSREAFIDRGIGQDDSEACEKLGILTKCRYFYKAPITKFTIYSIVNGFFLMSYVFALLLADRQSTSAENCGGFRSIFNCKLTMAQQFVYIWVLCLVPLEMRQIYFSYPTTLWGKLKMYWGNIYNKNDIVCIILILLALYFRMKGDSDTITWDGNHFRLLFSLAFIMYCLKLCQALQISEQLGPKVMMMQRMLIDLQFFIFLVVIFVIGYGVSTASIMTPQKFPKLERKLMFDIFWRPYTNLFGEIGEETIDEVMNYEYCQYFKAGTEDNGQCSDYSCDDEENTMCVFNIYIVKIMLGLYMMLAAVLMLNLLVAVFSSTYEEIQENSKTLWKRQKFDLMVEYRSRSPLPVPFSTILHCCRFIKLVIKNTCGRLSGCCADDPSDIPTVDVHQRLTITLLEIECRRNYLEKLKVLTDQEVLQAEMSNLSGEVETIEKRLGDFESKIQQVIDVATIHRHKNRSSSSSDEDEVDHDGPKLAVEDMIPEDITVEAGVVAPDMAGLPGGKKRNP